jgi:hypothetical protein
VRRRLSDSFVTVSSTELSTGFVDNLNLHPKKQNWWPAFAALAIVSARAVRPRCEQLIKQLAITNQHSYTARPIFLEAGISPGQS